MASPWYRATADAATIPPDVAERALEWLLLLQDEPVAADVLQQWTRWRAEHPAHERAWQRIESVRGRLQPLATPGAFDIAQAALAPPARRRAVKTMGIAALAGAIAWSVGKSPLLPALQARWLSDHRTAVGERREVALSDGTRLWLNTASAIDVQFDAQQRRIRLLAGEILVTTGHGPAAGTRPFLIETAQGTVRALGTRYAVRQHDDASEVGVYQGAVEIRPRDGHGRTGVLRAGSRAAYTASDISPFSPVEAARISWAEGVIVARSMRLDAFLAELSRYSEDRLSCDPSVAGLRVSGSFPLDSVDRVLDALASTLEVRTAAVTRSWGPREIRVLPRSRPAGSGNTPPNAGT
ncbi:FecR domain-containing protein [Paracidovorax citrulli]